MRATAKFPVCFGLIVASLGCDMGANSMSKGNRRIIELEEQAYRLNRDGDDEGAVKCIEEALSLSPDDEDLLETKANFLWNASISKDPSRFLAFCDDCLDRGVGRELYFRIWKAQVLHDMGTKWIDRHAVVVDSDLCDQAVAELIRAHEIDPNFVQTAEDADWVPMGWDEHFDGLRHLPKYQAIIGK